ncbi:MAG TPA: methyltransferase domain-containing protein [Dehalococcoidia bacterium]|nr:methyltransferase domain-containing protein [Dehalococcoidia bacterium]
MERTEWLQHEREKAEKLYDLYAPGYWDEIIHHENETQFEYLHKFLELIPKHSIVLSAACGGGQYDGILLEAGHSVVGIDQSEGMLAQAKERFPEIRYEKTGLQEMNFREEFDGITCIDALEYVCPEDWPGILHRFREALKPGGMLYFTTAVMEEDHLKEHLEKAKSMGLPAVIGEIVYLAEGDYEEAIAREEKVTTEEYTLYNYNPPLEQVRTWIRQSGLTIEEEGGGNEVEAYDGKLIWHYTHFIMRKK